MSLKERLHQKSKTLVARKEITLPMSGEKVTVRSLTAGEQLDSSREKDIAVQSIVMAAIATEDPESGKQLWNPNDLNDRNAIRDLHGNDLAAIARAIEELTGASKSDAEILGNSGAQGS